MQTSVLRIVTLSLMAVMLFQKLCAGDSSTKNSPINPDDTWVKFDETTIRQAKFDSSTEQPDSPVGTTGKDRPSVTRETQLHVEEGYDLNGHLVLDVVFISSSPAYKSIVKEARFTDGKIEFLDGNGAPVQLKSGQAELASGLASVAGASLIKGPVIQDIQAYAKAVSATIVGATPPGKGPASVTLKMLSRGSASASWTKTFTLSSQGWVLSQVAVNRPIAHGNTSSVVTFSNVVWHQNETNDATRKSSGTRRSTLARHAPFPSTTRAGQRTTHAAPPPASCNTTVTQLGGSQNVVFQHGLLGSSCSWTNSTYSMTAELNSLLSFGTEIVPSLTSTDPLASQTSALITQLQTTGGSHYVLIGHSQGGLISRSAAQYFQSKSSSTVTGVITVDTPNTGAALVENSIGAASQLGNYLNYPIDDIDAAYDCYDDYGDYGPFCAVGCSDPNGGALICGLMLAGTGQDNIINDAIDAAGIFVLNQAVPATVDLEPGSAFLNTLNSYPENFVRVGISSDASDFAPGPFLPEHMGGDLIGGTALGQDAVVTLQAADIALNAIIAYIIELEEDPDGDDCYDPDGPPDPDACYDDDVYIDAYAAIDNDIYVPDEYWDPLVYPAGDDDDFSDGIVNGLSQFYPPDSTVTQYEILGADTHLGSTKSAYVASALTTALEPIFFVPARGCTYTLSPSSVTEAASGGQGTFAMTTASGCAWSVVSSASWITFTPASGTGSATITYTIAANTGDSRSGNLMVAGVATFSITQNAAVSNTLTVTLTGSGTVKSSPAGISCPGTCSAPFTSGTVVDLTASAASGNEFTAWGGACSSSNPSVICPVTMSSAESVTASFAAGFSLQATSGSLTVALGSKGTDTVNVSPVNGFTGTVALTVSGLPTGLTAAFSPSSITGASGISTLTLTASATMTSGTYLLTITGTSGTSTHAVTITVTVPVNVAVSPTTVTLASGKTQTFTATVTGTTTKTVTWSAVYGTVSSTGHYTAPATASAETDTVYGCSTASPGTCGTASVSVTAASDFTITASPVIFNPSPEPLPQGGTAAFTITLTAVDGFTGSVKLTVPSLPTGISGSFSPATITGSGTSTLTLSATTSAALATDVFTVTGTSGSLVNSVSNSVQVVPGGVVVTLTPTTDTLLPGQSVQLTAKVTGTTNTGLTWSEPAFGTLSPTYLYTVTAAQSGIVLTDTISACSVVSPASCATTTITIPVGSGIFLGMPLLNYSGYVIPAGTSASLGFYVYGSPSGNVTPSMKGLPSGVTASFNPTVLNSSNSYSSTLTLTASKSVTIGSFVPTLSATNGTSTAISGVPITTETAPKISSVSPSSGAIGSGVTLEGIPYWSRVCSPPCASQSDFFGDTVTVTFNGVATVFSGGPGGVVVPLGLPAGPVSVVVTANGVPSNAATFTVTGPGLNSVSPAAATQGTPLTIAGINFGSTQGTGQVWIGGCLAPVLSWSSGQITVLTPGVGGNDNGYASGGVVVDTAGTPSNSLLFTMEPSLSGISPSSGAAGTTVNVTGSGLAGVSGGGIHRINSFVAGITFYNDVAAATPTEGTGTACVQQVLTTTVPTGATTGNVTAAISGYTSNPVTFTVP